MGEWWTRDREMGDITQPVWWSCRCCDCVETKRYGRLPCPRAKESTEWERNRSAKAAVQGECSCSRELSRVGQECCSLLFSCPHSCTETLAIIDPVLDPLCYLLLSPGLSFPVSLAFLLLVLSFSLTHPGGIPLSSDTGPTLRFHLFLLPSLSSLSPLA